MRRSSPVTTVLSWLHLALPRSLTVQRDQTLGMAREAIAHTEEMEERVRRLGYEVKATTHRSQA